MNCLTLSHWKNILTVALVALSYSTQSFGIYDLPSEVVIQVDGSEIKGTIGDADLLKETASEAPEELAPEGFIYKVERGPDPKVGIAVWSSSKREAKILKAAEAKLTEIIENNQIQAGIEPAGLHYTASESSRFGEDRPAQAAPVAKVKKAPVAKAPVVAVAPEAEVVVQKPVEVAAALPETKVDLAPLTAGSSVEVGGLTGFLQNYEFSTRMLYWIALALMVLGGGILGSRKSY